jgi:aspartyl-tRNA synthetase
MIICNEDAMRDVVAFPTTSSGQTSIMDAPSQVSPEQLKELGLSINDKKKRK